MLSSSFKLTCFLLFISIASWQCHHKDIQPVINCGEGYEVIDDQCQCPPSKKELYGLCRTLSTLSYYGITSGCYCPDTMLLTLKDTLFDPFTQTFSIGVQFVNPDWDFPGTETRTARLAYFPQVEGDSIEGEIWFGVCQIGDQPCLRYLYGKRIGTDTLRLKIVYRSYHLQEDMAVPVDSCLIYLHK